MGRPAKNRGPILAGEPEPEPIPENTKNRLFERIYYDAKNPGAFGGIDALYRSAKREEPNTTLAQAASFLKSQDSYTLHKPIRRNFARRRTIVTTIDEQWQGDLADMSDVSQQNDGYRYILVIVDCFSKYAWALPQKTKDAKATTVIMEKILMQEAAPRKPQRLQTDKGKEFCNSTFTGMLKRHNIHHFTTQNEEIKAAMVERLIRTLKSLLYRYFTHTHKERYIEVLPDILTRYNASFHRTIGMAPNEVGKQHVPFIYDRVYGKDTTAFIANHNKNAGVERTSASNEMVGPASTVRLSHPHKSWSKGYEPSWTRELYKITATSEAPAAGGPSRIYKVSDLEGEPIIGSFYKHEIQPVEVPQEKDLTQKLHEIEKILRRRGKGANAKVYVKWKGLHRKFNKWIPANSIVNQ
jgi:hypothetical protein